MIGCWMPNISVIAVFITPSLDLPYRYRMARQFNNESDRQVSHDIDTSEHGPWTKQVTRLWLDLVFPRALHQRRRAVARQNIDQHDLAAIGGDDLMADYLLAGVVAAFHQHAGFDL